MKLYSLLTTGVVGGIISQASFNNTINLGAVLVAFLVIIVAGFFTLRDKVTKSQIDGWRGNYEAEKEAREIVQQKLDESIQQLRSALTEVGDQKRLIERLEALPNLERVIKLMAETTERQHEYGQELARGLIVEITRMIDLHEAEAIDRHLEIMRELREIRKSP